MPGRLISTILGLALALLMVLTPTTASADNPAVRIGVLANKGDSAAIETWQPLVDYLNEVIPEHDFVLVPLNFDNLYPQVEQEQIEFIITNTGQYIELESYYGTSRIATFRNATPEGYYTKFGGVLFVCADREDIRSISDFPGYRVLIADEKSFGGWLMQLREIKAQGVDPGQFAKLESTGNHEEVVYAVLEGKSDIGAIRTDTLERMAAAGKIDFSHIRVINEQHDSNFPYRHSTRLYPEWPFAKAAHTDSQLAQSVTIALLTLPEDSPAALASQGGGWTIPEDYSSVHDLFRELELGPYASLGEFSAADVIAKYWPVILLSVLLLVVAGTAAGWISIANHRLQTALADVSTAHAELGKANNLLIESVEYAQIIQESLLPDPQVLSGIINEVTVLWKPLNMVGGDYYWLGQIDNKVIILVADCTGHGIPGAMVTMILSASLDFILHEGKVTDPGQILTEIDQTVRSRLRQDEPDSTSDDGLEAAVCVYDPQTQTLSFAGAGLPLLLVKDGDTHKDRHAHLIKGDRAYLGYRTLQPKGPFQVHDITVEPGMTFYMFTDGITDQMGGRPQQLFGRNRLLDLIAGLEQQQLTEQITVITDHLESYRGDENIRDDMTLIAFRI